MARKLKHENKQQSLRLKDSISEQNLSEDDIIYIHRHNVTGDEKYLVKDIENNLLNKKVLVINQHYDSSICDSDGLRFIIE